MSIARKKVILRTSTDSTHAGYLPLTGLTRNDPDHTVDLLALDGRVVSFPLAQVQSICYVRDFNPGDAVNPERLTRRTFLARPRSEGLWMRLELTAGEPLEGLAASDVSLLDSLLEDRGVFLTPPDIRSNTQRVFIPRSAIVNLQLIAVVTTPSRPKALAVTPDLQDDLFPDVKAK